MQLCEMRKKLLLILDLVII